MDFVVPQGDPHPRYVLHPQLPPLELGQAYQYARKEEGVVQHLKPCPFCGFQPQLSDGDCLYPSNRERTLWSVHCYEIGGGCGIEGPVCSSAEDAIDFWNRRS